MAEVMAKAVIQTADGGFVEASSVAFAELAASENGVLFVEAVAVAVLELEGGCKAIAEAIAQAQIINGEVAEVISKSTVEIVCEEAPQPSIFVPSPQVVPTLPPITPTPTPSPKPTPTPTPPGSLVPCDFTVLQCFGTASDCCKANMVPGQSCFTSPIANEYTYSGYCSDNPSRMLLTPKRFGFECFCPV
eukprot:TRINITY_DN3324_c0_g1_i1.p3 TRINITY_DN3324_c0_g1~~TRINITY_DN3324_c0_g1_i1.p3  ORF type:complete len:190 (+),score=41.94 TRINITY_DN3324_c0_g1_i1:1396-1965(+)